MKNISQFMNCVVRISNENYNPTAVLEKIGDYDNLVYYIQLYKKEVEAKKDELNQLNQDINYSKELLDASRIKIDVIGEFEKRMGFGINEVRNLYDTLMEIGRENNINNKTFEQIKKEFFDISKVIKK